MLKFSNSRNKMIEDILSSRKNKVNFNNFENLCIEMKTVNFSILKCQRVQTRLSLIWKSSIVLVVKSAPLH